jgi:hypothetical protein
MPVTSSHSSNDPNGRTRKALTGRLTIDLTGPREISERKTIEIAKALEVSMRAALASLGLEHARVSADLDWVYGPWWKLRIEHSTRQSR